MSVLEDINNVRRVLRAKRHFRREHMTRPERALVWTLVFGPTLLVLVAVALLVSGRSHALGIGLLLVALVGFAVPVRPVVIAKVQRRMTREGRDLSYRPPE